MSISYRGSWLFIADSDLSAKVTFSLFSHLLALQSVEAQRVLPALPVGR